MGLEELRGYLTERTGERWLGKDSSYFGEYIAIRSTKTLTVFRIFVEGDGYVVDLARSPENREKWDAEYEEFQQILRGKKAEGFTSASHRY